MYKQTIYSQQKLIKIKITWLKCHKRWTLPYNLCNKIVRIKQKIRNKMYNDNHNDIYDNNISNKNQLDLSLSNVKSDDWWLEWLRRKKINIRKTSVTLNELMTFKKKYHYTKTKVQRNA